MRKEKMNSDAEPHRIGISIDIEDWYHIPPVSGTPNSKFPTVREFRNDWHDRYDYITDAMRTTLDIFDRFDMTVTIFLVADIIDNYPEIIDDIRARGRHEIGCHGLTHTTKIDPHSKKPLLETGVFKDLTGRARKQIEEVFNVNVVGYRAPNAYMGGWMMDALEDLGFTYSSSVSANSFYNKTDSKLSGVSTVPYIPALGSLEAGDRTRGIAELPFAHYHRFGMRIPTNGGPILRLLGPSIIKKGLRDSLERGHTIFYFHPLDITREDFPNTTLINKIFWRTKGEKVQSYIEEILSDLSEDAIFVPLKDIAESVLFGADVNE